MGRRRTTATDISLFPFLSILVCVIGLLTLMIAGSSLTEIGEKPDPAALARTEEYRKLQSSVDANRTFLDKVKDRLSSSGLGEARFDAAKRKLDEVQAEKRQRDERDVRFKQSADLQARLAELHERLAKLTQELKTRTDLVAELDKQIEQKGKLPEAVVSIRPTGTGQNQDAVYVECTDAGIAILEDAAADQPRRVRTADLAADSAFLDLLDRVSSSTNGIVIFLLRDNGTDAYWSARNVADARGARNGKVPVIGHGRIDLSRVQKRRK